MPWKIKVFMLIDVEKPEVYQDKEEADMEAANIEFMQPSEMQAMVVECDDKGQEV